MVYATGSQVLNSTQIQSIQNTLMQAHSQGAPRGGSGQRKKAAQYSNFLGNNPGKMSNNSTFRSPNTQGGPRGSSNKGNPQYINLSQSQRLNMHNYNQIIKNPSHGPNQSLKEYQELSKAQADHRSINPQLNHTQVLQHHGPILSVQPQSVKQKKVHSPQSFQYQQHDDLGFLNKLSTQQREGQMQ